MPPQSISILSGSSSIGKNRYALLELPPDLLSIVEASAAAASVASTDVPGEKRSRGEHTVEDEEEEHARSKTRLTINGRYADDAVLCTYDKTYALRAVSQSNSFLLCKLDSTPHPTGALAERSNVRLDATLSTTLELLAMPPRLERLGGLLRSGAYEGEEAERELDAKGSSVKRYTPKQIRSIVQASEVDLQRGLDERRVLLLDGFYRPISPSYLRSLLSALLTHVALHSFIPSSMPLAPALVALKEEGAREEVARAVLTKWFGKSVSFEKSLDDVEEEYVGLDMKGIAQCLGLGLLAEIKPHSSQPLAAFLKSWRAVVGDLLESEVRLELLDGHHLLSPPQSSILTSTAHTPPPQTISPYSVTTLPLSPAERFRELFLHRQQWTLGEITPFLSGLVVEGDKKATDGLLLRFARRSLIKVEVPGGKKGGKKEEVVLYSARVKF